MAARNYIPPSELNPRRYPNPLEDPRRYPNPLEDPRLIEHHLRVPPDELLLMEDRINAQSREIQTLLHDNQRLASIHVALKQELVATEQELRHLSTDAASVKADRVAQVTEVFERSRELEDEARLINGLSADIDRVRADIKQLRAEREELSEKLKGTEADLTATRTELREFPSLKAEIEIMHREIQRGRSAIEYERKMHAHNFEISEAMEKHMISMTCEAEKLRAELETADKRAMAAAVAAANPGN